MKNCNFLLAPCPTQPPHVDNGIRIFEGVRHNSRARYICRGGYRLRGMASESPFLTCKYGSWIGGRPVCEECKFWCLKRTIISKQKFFHLQIVNIEISEWEIKTKMLL